MSENTKSVINEISSLFGIPNAAAFAAEQFKDSLSDLKELNSILTDISKTSQLTTAQLKELGDVSFEKASKYGKKANDYLLTVQEMANYGFHGGQGEKMAQTSLLAQTAGNMDSSTANDYVLATNAAYELKGQTEKLNAVLDGQTNISTRHNMALKDMAEATTKAGSAAADAGVSIQQLSAMIGTIQAATSDGGNNVGSNLQALLTTLQDISNDKVVGTLEKANAPMTAFVNGVEQLRNPIDILKDLSATYNSLGETDTLKSQIIRDIGQGNNGTALTALLSNWSTYETMLTEYSQGIGIAEAEAAASASNWEGSLNRLSNTWTSTVSNIADSDAIITGINALNELLSVVNKLTGFLGSWGSIGLGAGLFAGINNTGKCV